MNWQQALSALRTALQAGGPLGALLIALGYSHTEELSRAVEAMIVLLAAAPPIVGGVWGWLTHRKSNAIAVVAAMPGVENVKISPVAPAELTAIAADPSQPKVTQ